jgi:hypothetical protein
MANDALYEYMLAMIESDAKRGRITSHFTQDIPIGFQTALLAEGFDVEPKKTASITTAAIVEYTNKSTISWEYPTKDDGIAYERWKDTWRHWKKLMYPRINKMIRESSGCIISFNEVAGCDSLVKSGIPLFEADGLRAVKYKGDFIQLMWNPMCTEELTVPE